MNPGTKQPGFQSWKCWVCNVGGEGNGLDEHLATAEHARLEHQCFVAEAKDAIRLLREHERKNGLERAELGGVGQ